MCRPDGGLELNSWDNACFGAQVQLKPLMQRMCFCGIIAPNCRLNVGASLGSGHHQESPAAGDMLQC